MSGKILSSENQIHEWNLHSLTGQLECRVSDLSRIRLLLGNIRNHLGGAILESPAKQDMPVQFGVLPGLVDFIRRLDAEISTLQCEVGEIRRISGMDEVDSDAEYSDASKCEDQTISSMSVYRVSDSVRAAPLKARPKIRRS